MALIRIDNQIVDENFVVREGEKLSLNIVTLESGKPCKISAVLENNASFAVAFADFGSWTGEVIIDVYLNGENANFYFHCASYCSVNENKRFEVNAFHKGRAGKSLVSCYGIAADHGVIRFEGASKIEKESIGSSTRQEAKAILFDRYSQGFCSPVLKIEENEIEASHAASVGRVNDDHLFYLTSRGLTKEEAKKLIVLGYLKPIVNYVDDESIKESIVKRIEERV